MPEGRSPSRSISSEPSWAGAQTDVFVSPDIAFVGGLWVVSSLWVCGFAGGFSLSWFLGDISLSWVVGEVMSGFWLSGIAVSVSE